MASDQIARFWAPAALLLSSAGSMALEIAAGRLMAPYVGMSLYSWTAIIAVVLAGLSVGHWIGGVMADRSRRRRCGLGGSCSSRRR
ncbi:MAG: fused MFS/spermidine synthase [Pseudomonadota bacterium]